MRDSQNHSAPDHIVIRGARVHNLKNLNLEVPLGKLVGIAGVSGSGKSSLALGILYAEGSRRYLEALSTYTRRRMTQAAEAKIDSIENVPGRVGAAPAPCCSRDSQHLRHGNGTAEQPAPHVFPSGKPPLSERPRSASDGGCGAGKAPGLPGLRRLPSTAPAPRSFAFNSEGACPTCGGTGIVRTVDEIHPGAG